ncbi:MAG: hypothetical protein WBW99_08740 [Pseudolabrys sp.]
MNVESAQDKSEEIAFFDAHAESNEYDVFTPQANERLITAFMQLSGLPPGARVADLGCGSGVSKATPKICHSRAQASTAFS